MYANLSQCSVLATSRLLVCRLVLPVHARTQICDTYPEWLATHRDSLPPADYQRFGQQYQSFQRVLAVYEVGTTWQQTDTTR